MSAFIGIARKVLTNLDRKYGAALAPYDPALKVLNCVFIYAIGLTAINGYRKEKRFAALLDDKKFTALLDGKGM